MQAHDTDDIGVADKAACSMAHGFSVKMLSTFLAFESAQLYGRRDLRDAVPRFSEPVYRGRWRNQVRTRPCNT